MERNNKYWLPHLENALPTEAFSDNLSMYTIALEGWRRGLTLKFFTINTVKGELKVRYSLTYQDREHKFSLSKGDKITSEAITTCKSKELTKQVLIKANVPTPIGDSFSSETSDEEIVMYANSIGYPLVVKPTDGSLGRGVMVNLQDEAKLRQALTYVRKELNYTDVIVEQFVEGEECRIYVIEDKVIGAANRIPANVIGDGTNNIETLIALKNKERKKNPTLSKRPLKVDNEVFELLASSGYTLQSVPKKGEQVFLRQKSNLSAGGDPVDYTDQLTPEIKDIAVRAVKATGMLHCGLDMMINKEKNTGSIIEVNSRAHFGSIMFPMEGVARDVPKAIVDYYFPETVDAEKSSYYFNMKQVMDILKNKLADEVIIPPAPQEEHVARKYTVSGDVQGVGYRRWVQKQARFLKLYGFAENLKNGKVIVLISGQKESVEQFDQRIHNEGPEKAIVKKVMKSEWTKPVKVGFEVLGQNISKYTIRLEAKLKDEKELTKTVTSEKEAMEKKYEKLINSRTWRYTSSIRKLASFRRRLFQKG
ncbi:hypothetical protein BKP45_03355 [Anaerobacillus alkalidiazotrophicus]|uniref:acylphosphatase n=1 Tax=Anaerobacillus alkalidiazotrophicus TaxID=472963 RepID=A0A1S2MAL6_9BACI|nr:acylphosphatase [Anaerobacillus alkalidiazotrophicus]OIJ21748.1 hypothetical protein BKP45_03355 [Anaerobacillus alkalidiazotrophicus]